MPHGIRHMTMSTWRREESVKEAGQDSSERKTPSIPLGMPLPTQNSSSEQAAPATVTATNEQKRRQLEQSWLVKNIRWSAAAAVVEETFNGHTTQPPADASRPPSPIVHRRYVVSTDSGTLAQAGAGASNDTSAAAASAASAAAPQEGRATPHPHLRLHPPQCDQFLPPPLPLAFEEVTPRHHDVSDGDDDCDGGASGATDGAPSPKPRPSTLKRMTKRLARRIVQRVRHVIEAVFLPAGYPQSVQSPDYARYYGWLFVQSVAGSTSYIMSMEALLHSVGVASNAMGWAAAVSWVLKDGLGSIGMILAAKVMGDANKFDADTMRAKFRADVAHNLGVALELMTHVFPAYFLALASVANTLKGVAGLTNGACKAAINRQLAIQNNMGDVTAKGFAQGLAAYLTGLLLGIALNGLVPHIMQAATHVAVAAATLFVGLVGGDGDAGAVSSTLLELQRAAESAGAGGEAIISRIGVLWMVFMSLVGVHVWASYRALRSIALRSLNLERTTLLLQHFLSLPPESRASAAVATAHVLQPDQVRDRQLEYIVKRNPLLERVPHIVLGTSVDNTFADQRQLSLAVRTFLHDKYLLQSRPDLNSICVHFHVDTPPTDILRGFIHTYLLREMILSSSHDDAAAAKSTSMVQEQEQEQQELARVLESKQACAEMFDTFLTSLRANGWHVDEIMLLSSRPKSRSRWSTPGGGTSGTGEQAIGFERGDG